MGAIVNCSGGAGRNIEGDKAQEICNCTSKSVVQGMGPHKTTNAIITVSKAAPGIHDIKKNFDSTTKIHSPSQAHSTRSSRDDELSMLKELRTLFPSHITPHQCHNHFQEIEVSPLVGLDMEKCFEFLEKHKKQIAMG